MKREERKHMIYSMTGYGRASAVRGGREITVELRSVNARYFEYTSRIPRSCAFLDSRLKALLNSRIARGKVEVSLTVQDLEAAGTEVAVDMDLARGYQQALRDMSEALGVKNDVTAGQLWADVSDVAAQAVQNFVEMRGIEGEKMLEDITGRLDTVESCVGRIEELTAGRVEKYTQRLYERLKVILEDRAIDDARVLTEAAIFGDKTAVDEETVRLRSHIAQYREILGSGQPVGRKLDFLTQELNREANTIGSKCQDLDITRIVVDMKAEIEKIREQIQNLE